MSTIQQFLNEMEQEAVTTRKMLQCVPDDKFDWKPHPKSMSIRQLSGHIAELPTWITMAFTTDELDFAKAGYTSPDVNNGEQLLDFFEKSLADGRTELVDSNESKLAEPWTLRNGDKILQQYSKASVIRMSLSQVIHHRAQLGVYLRLLDIPIPGSYGPSADTMDNF